MRVTLQPAYVLHTRPFRESSLLVEVFSRDHGRIGLVARGARGAKSRWKNMLQPFRPLLTTWVQKSDLGTLTGADQVASPPQMQGESLFCGLYANELIMRFLHRSDPHPALFDDYQQLLHILSAGDPLQAPLRVFEKRLLGASGFGLQLEFEHGSNRPIEPGEWYQYLPDSGPVRRDRGDRQAEEWIAGESLIALHSEVIETRHLRDLKRLMRTVIRHQLGDKPIASQQLFI